jgi:hypothetical protein
VDREKLVAVRKFVDQGGDELFYLSDRMSEIMSMFIYQSSRRQLLAELMQHLDKSTERRESLSGHEHLDEESKKKHEVAVKQASNLGRAVEAADSQVKRLEYWSDIKSMARRGETLHATDSSHWNQANWQGLDPASPSHDQEPFRSKQHHTEPAPDLHSQPEHEVRREQQHSNQTDSSGYVTAATTTSKAKKSSKKNDADSEKDGEIFVTAPETPTMDPSSPSSKGKGKVTSFGLDGVLEEDFKGEAHAESVSEEPRDDSAAFKDAKEVQSLAPSVSREEQDSRSDSLDESNKDDGHIVEIVEPKAINADYDEAPMLSRDEPDAQSDSPNEGNNADEGNKDDGHIVEIVEPKAINADYDEAPMI